MVMLVEEPTVIITATVASLVFVPIATLIGLHIRSRARLRTANAVASAATTHAATLQTDLTNQQLADAIAAEAHDTLAHSLSLMALNASALKAEAAKLGDSPKRNRWRIRPRTSVGSRPGHWTRPTRSSTCCATAPGMGAARPVRRHVADPRIAGCADCGHAQLGHVAQHLDRYPAAERDG